jgi:ABC-type glutathione transport system ATPase component
MDTIATTVDTNLIATTGVCKTYQQPDHAGRLVLDHIDFTLKEGEIVAILGKLRWCFRALRFSRG